MSISIKLDEDNIEFHPGQVQYSIMVVINGEKQAVNVARDNFNGTFAFEDKSLNPIIKRLVIECIKEHIAKLHIKGLD